MREYLALAEILMPCGLTLVSYCSRFPSGIVTTPFGNLLRQHIREVLLYLVSYFGCQALLYF